MRENQEKTYNNSANLKIFVIIVLKDKFTNLDMVLFIILCGIVLDLTLVQGYAAPSIQFPCIFSPCPLFHAST